MKKDRSILFMFEEQEFAQLAKYKLLCNLCKTSIFIA